MNQIQLPPGLETVCFVLGENVYQDIPEILKTHFPGRRPWIVADENTRHDGAGSARPMLRGSSVKRVVARPDGEKGVYRNKRNCRRSEFHKIFLRKALILFYYTAIIMIAQ